MQPIRRLRVLASLACTLALALSTPGALKAQNPISTPGWGDWTMVWNRPEPAHVAPGNRDGSTSTAPDSPATPDDSWLVTYEIWQQGISYLSALGPIAPIHGRSDVLLHADEIRWWAPDDLELLVAASIAHQASDFKDRPFGTDVLEVVWRELVDDNISVGIAQLRREEVAYWAPQLRGLDLLSPEVAIRVMTAKLNQTNRYILENYPSVDDTDRFMLLALAQNAASYYTMRNTVTYFFRIAQTDWSRMLTSTRADELSWREQLRLVLLHADWLVEQGWPEPAGLDLERWSRIAFSEP